MQELKLRAQNNEKLKEESELRKQKLREIDTAKVAKMEDQKEAFTDESDNVKLLDRAFLAKQEQVSRDCLSNIKFTLISRKIFWCLRNNFSRF